MIRAPSVPGVGKARTVGKPNLSILKLLSACELWVCEENDLGGTPLVVVAEEAFLGACLCSQFEVNLKLADS